MSGKIADYGILGQINTMLNNHGERPMWNVEAKLKDCNGNLLDNKEFKVYIELNDVDKEFNDKVNKLRSEGGLPSLRILKLNTFQDKEDRHVYVEFKI